MSNREIAKNLIDQIPESRLFYVISYLHASQVVVSVFRRQLIRYSQNVDGALQKLHVIPPPARRP